MGGVIILGAVLVSMLLWGNFTSPYLIMLIVATVFLGALGFADDYIKSIMKKKDGVPARVKLLVQVTRRPRRRAADILFSRRTSWKLSTLYVPFINEAVAGHGVHLGLLRRLVIVATSNAVNLTDGLDGLAIGSVMIVGVSLGIMAYLTGHIKIAGYLRIPYIPEAPSSPCSSRRSSGASLGFLWFNSNPATVFMGDTGSLALGGIIGIVAVMIKKEIFLFIVGGVFVVEALSVIIQVASFKLRGKRVFKMAPHPSPLRAVRAGPSRRWWCGCGYWESYWRYWD